MQSRNDRIGKSTSTPARIGMFDTLHSILEIINTAGVT